MGLEFEKEVCALEYAKELKELGFTQESLFFWVSGGLPEKWWITYKCNFTKPYHPEKVSAFTASELIQMLPNTLTIKENEPFNNFRLKITKILIFCEKKESFISVCSCNYECDTFSMDEKINFPMALLPHNIWDENLANTLAKTVIHIIKNNYTNLNT